MRKLLFACLLACTTNNQAATSVSGQAVYRDAASQPQPATPPAQNAKLSIVVKGTGTIPQVDPHCATDPLGAFEAHYASTLDVSGDHAYLGSVTEGTLQTPSGCTIPDLQVNVITDVVIRGELAITTENCNTYCAASARADAETQCGTNTQCRANMETSLAAQCTTRCTSQSHAIVAETSLGASAVGHLDANDLKAAALGDLHAQLTFSRLE